jgi:hypothetical protein
VNFCLIFLDLKRKQHLGGWMGSSGSAWLVLHNTHLNYLTASAACPFSATPIVVHFSFLGSEFCSNGNSPQSSVQKIIFLSRKYCRTSIYCTGAPVHGVLYRHSIMALYSMALFSTRQVCHSTRTLIVLGVDD